MLETALYLFTTYVAPRFAGRHEMLFFGLSGRTAVAARPHGPTPLGTPMSLRSLSGAAQVGLTPASARYWLMVFA